MFGTDLRQRLFGDGKVFVFLKPERAPVRMSPLKDVIAGKDGENERAFLLHERDALGASAHVQMTGLEAIELNAA